jgi:MFS family permease
VIRNNWRALIIGTFVMLATYTLFYLVNTWTLSYAIAARPPKGNGLGIGYMNFLQMQLISVLFFAAMLPVVGRLADRFGRRSTLLVSTLAIIAYGATFGPLLAAGRATPASVLTFLIVGMSLMGLSFGPMSAVLPELFPTNVRYTGSGIAYNLASILGAAVAPFIATWLAATHGVGWVGCYLSVSAVVTFIAVLAMRETKDRPLDAEPEPTARDVCPAES